MFGSTSIRSTVVTGQTEGLKVGCGGMGGRRDGWMGGFKEWVGLQKLIMKNGYKGGVWRFSHLLQFIDFFHFFMI